MTTTIIGGTDPTRYLAQASMMVNVAMAPTISNMPLVVFSALVVCGVWALPGIAIEQVQSVSDAACTDDNQSLKLA